VKKNQKEKVEAATRRTVAAYIEMGRMFAELGDSLKSAPSLKTLETMEWLSKAAKEMRFAVGDEFLQRELLKDSE
jgi:hypothetical protein